jgi:transposase, IS30 family
MVEEKLRQDWSPEQVSGWLKRADKPSLSPEWIYQHMLADKARGANLYNHLRCHKKHRKRYGSYDRRGKLPNRISGEERPEWSNNVNVSAIGKWTPWLGRVIEGLW